MLPCFRSALLVGCCALFSGCGLHPDILTPGRSFNRGCLIHYSSDPPHADRPTVVITHGFNPLPNFLRLSMDEGYARAIRRRYGEQVNVFGWDWNYDTFNSLSGRANGRNAQRQGCCLAKALREAGVDTSRTHLIGHSLGSVVIASAAHELAGQGSPVASLTFLDAVCVQHRLIFDVLNAPACARRVYNYWAPGPSGVGRPAACPGVHDECVPGTWPWLGTVDFTLSNHVTILKWYLATIYRPQIDSGFNRLELFE